MVVAAAMSLPAIASAHSGEFSKFDQCPSTNVEVKKCIDSVVEGGEFVLGSKKVPIVNPVTLQGGFGKANAEKQSTFYEATNGVTLSKSPQPVPGGLAGLINCKEISNFILRAACEFTLENGLTGLNSTLELARPVSEIQISEFNLVLGKGTALKLPVKVHLENPFLGSACYVGSSSAPIYLNLTTGTTAPPPPNAPITGNVGTGTFLEGGQIGKIENLKLVDNAWSAPGASGCGGPIVELLLDPVINAASGLPAAAGKNTAIQATTSYTATTKAVNEH
jgi:hypothetical protein